MAAVHLTGDDGGPVSSDALLVQTNDQRQRNQSAIERKNLLNICNICVKILIDAALKCGRALDESFSPLQQFFIVLEHVLRHGLKVKRQLLGQRKDYWGVLEASENHIAFLPETLLSIRNLTNIRTNLGRGRAWMRLSMMQKTLADQMHSLIEEKELLRDWYEPHSLMISDDAMIISGLLVGLNVIDCNLDLKGEDVDSPNGVIDISLYLRDGNYLDKGVKDYNTSGEEETQQDQKHELILDQKAYLEELNRTLNDNLTQLQNKLQSSKVEMTSVGLELGSCKKSVDDLTQENVLLTQENESLKSKSDRQIIIAQADITAERETYNQSRSGLNEMYIQVKKQFETEAQHKKEIQKDLQLQIAMSQEREVAMRLLEKDIHEKQDTLVSLRRQVDDIKKINIEMHNKWQAAEASLKDHVSSNNATEERCRRLIAQTKELEKSLEAAEKSKKQAFETANIIGKKLADVDAERHSLETNIRIEREWRTGLQTELEQQKGRNSKQEKEVGNMKSISLDNERLRAKVKELESRCSEQESALVEMGSHLSRSQQHVEDLKETTAAMKDKVWTDDKDISSCQSCEQLFSMARRKHHCRSCGGIYCNACSDNTMPLASSAKPVRVCDTCYQTLLSRYNATT